MEEPERPERPSADRQDGRVRVLGGVVLVAGVAAAGFAFADPSAGLAARVFTPLFLVGVALLVLLQERRAAAEAGDVAAAGHSRRMEGATRVVLVVLLGVAVATVFDGASDGIFRVVAIPLAVLLLALARRVLSILERSPA